MKYRIVGDSCLDITQKECEEYNIGIAPLTFTIDGKEFIDDESLDLDLYLKTIDNSRNVPKSSCPSSSAFIEKFKGDYDYIFVITLSSKLSGSYNSASVAAKMYEDKHPEKKVHVFDSKGASTTEYLIAMKIIELANSGHSFEEIVEKVEHFRDTTQLLFVLDKLDTLEKNGRLPLLKARILKVLNLKLIMKALPEGIIDLADKARGTKKALIKMVDMMKNFKPIDKDSIIAISHCESYDRAMLVKEMIEEKYSGFRKIVILKMKGVSSTYANRGGIIVSF